MHSQHNTHTKEFKEKKDLPAKKLEYYDVYKSGLIIYRQNEYANESLYFDVCIDIESKFHCSTTFRQKNSYILILYLYSRCCHYVQNSVGGITI